MKIPNNRDLQQMASNHPTDNEFKGIMKLYTDYTKELFSVLMSDTIFSSDNPLTIRKNVI